MTEGTTCEIHGCPLYGGYWCLFCNNERNEARQRRRAALLVELEIKQRVEARDQAEARKSLLKACVKYGYDGGECGQSLEDWIEERLQRLIELETAP
jgi:hypothetical protein